MIIIGIDPGPNDSAGVTWDSEKETVLHTWHELNVKVMPALRGKQIGYGLDMIAIEDPVAVRRPASNDFINTVKWSARFYQTIYDTLQIGEYDKLQLITYGEISAHFCKITNAKEKFVKEELLARFGPQGTKKATGKLFGVSGHCWSALAVAVVAGDKFGPKVMLQDYAKRNHLTGDHD